MCLCHVGLWCMDGKLWVGVYSLLCWLYLDWYGLCSMFLDFRSAWWVPS